MIRRLIQIPVELWEQAKRKAGYIGVSEVIRRLLGRWLAGDIEVIEDDEK